MRRRRKLSPAPSPSPSPPPGRPPEPPRPEAVATLLGRIKAKLPEFGKCAGGSARAVRVSYAPGRLDVMGGSAEFGGTMVVAGTIDRGVAIAMAQRGDRKLFLHSLQSHAE